MSVDKKTIEVYHVKQLPNERDEAEGGNAVDWKNNSQYFTIDLSNKVAEKHDDIKKIDFDDLLPFAGEFGRYQIFLFFLTMPFYLYGVFVYFTQMFLTEVSSQHWCRIPELENLTINERRSLGIPLEDNHYGYSRCQMYEANWSNILADGIRKPDPSWNVIPCQNGWEFDTTDIPYPTISSDLGWVCERDSYQATAQSIFFLGSIMGGFLVGWLADRFGRLPGAIVSNLFGCVGGIATIFAKNFTEFSICRFLTGFAYDNCMMMVYILVLEYTAPKYRTLMANTTFALFYALGACVLPWIALACGHWKTLSLATSIPLALVVLTPFFVPESPRWLLSKGRIQDAVEKLLVIGRVNKKVVPPKLIEQFKLTAIEKTDNEKASKMEILKRPALRKMFILICIEYMCCCIVFDSLVRSLGQLEFDFFISFTIVSFTEFPSLLLVAFIMDWLGRRWLAAIFMTISSIFCFLTAFIGGGLPAVLCAVVARFAVNMSYNAAIQWAAELLPTGVRASGASTIHIFGYMATILSPYIVYLKTVLPWLPLVVVGFIAALGVVIALALPETAGRDMPQSFDDAEDLARSRDFWRIPCLDKKKEVEGCNNEGFEN